jgi:hypothetical protein
LPVVWATLTGMSESTRLKLSIFLFSLLFERPPLTAQLCQEVKHLRPQRVPLNLVATSYFLARSPKTAVKIFENRSRPSSTLDNPVWSFFWGAFVLTYDATENCCCDILRTWF